MLPRFALGDTLALTSSLADYPASAGWVLHYRLVPRDGAGTAVAFNSTAAGDAHAILVPAATTAAWAGGVYTWSSWVALGAQSFSLGLGVTELLLNPRTATGPLDLRSAAQVALDNVRAALRGKAGADVLSYTINGRSLQRYSVAELIALESKLALDVGRENRAAALAAGRPDPRRMTVRLARA